MSLSVTYTFTASTAARAAEVNQNFTDIVSFVNTEMIVRDGSVAFTGIPTLPAVDPTSANQATRKAYVDAQLSSFPSGLILPYGGSTAPSGYLLCNGQAVSRTTYDRLFAVISTAFGVGNGTTTFNVPDLRGRVPVGVDNIGGSDAGRLDVANSIGGTGGTQKHTLIVDEMPAHAHASADGADFRTDDAGSANTIGSVISGGLDNGRETLTAETGGGDPHENMPPYQLTTYVIKT